MKVFATSDLHGNLEGLDLEGIDLAILAGDIAPLKGMSSWDVYDQLVWMNTEFNDWCNRWPNAKIVFTPGNHDFFPLIKDRFGEKLREENLDLKLASNATMLIDKCIDIYGSNSNVSGCLRVYGTPWVPIISHRWAFEAEHDKLQDKFAQIPKDVDILVTHAPPRLNCVDVSLDYGVNSERFGSSELSEAIAFKFPKMCFCGHIHSGSHSMSKLGSTQVWNVSRLNESYNIAYEPLRLEV